QFSLSSSGGRCTPALAEVTWKQSVHGRGIGFFVSVESRKAFGKYDEAVRRRRSRSTSFTSGAPIGTKTEANAFLVLCLAVPRVARFGPKPRGPSDRRAPR